MKALVLVAAVASVLLVPGTAGARHSASTTTHTLTVIVAGTGSGHVFDSWNKIPHCTSTCTADYEAGADVFLIAGPEFGSGSVFSGWSGEGCSGTGICDVTMDQDRTVTATFSPATTFDAHVIPIGSGSGRVVSDPAGIDCGSTCTGAFGAGSAVTLAATPDPGSFFAGWSGDCSGTGSCVLTMNSSKFVEPSFRLQPATVDSITATCAGNTLTAAATAHGTPGSNFVLTLEKSNNGTTFTDTGRSATVAFTGASSYLQDFDLTSLTATSYRVVSGDVRSDPVSADACGPGTTIPEAPATALLLPLSLLGMFGLAAAALYMRRRNLNQQGRTLS